MIVTIEFGSNGRDATVFERICWVLEVLDVEQVEVEFENAIIISEKAPTSTLLNASTAINARCYQRRWFEWVNGELMIPGEPLPLMDVPAIIFKMPCLKIHGHTTVQRLPPDCIYWISTHGHLVHPPHKTLFGVPRSLAVQMRSLHLHLPSAICLSTQNARITYAMFNGISSICVL